jgi:hypothetical protein
LRELAPDVPAGLVAVVERLMNKEPAQRYASAAEVVEALRPFVSLAPPAPPAPPLPIARLEMPILPPVALAPPTPVVPPAPPVPVAAHKEASSEKRLSRQQPGEAGWLPGWVRRLDPIAVVLCILLIVAVIWLVFSRFLF